MGHPAYPGPIEKPGVAFNNLSREAGDPLVKHVLPPLFDEGLRMSGDYPGDGLMVFRADKKRRSVIDPALPFENGRSAALNPGQFIPRKDFFART